MRCRPLIAFALAALLGLTGLTVGAVRGQAEAVGTYVICTGHGTITIHVDADGRETGAPHHCPDCTLLFVAADIAGSGAHSAPELAGRRVATPEPDHLTFSFRISALARAPPRAA